MNITIIKCLKLIILFYVLGNQNPYSQGYHQSMERYPTGYPGGYQSSRYQGNSNTMDYQSTSNAMHYPQASGNVPHNSIPGQSQYNQYSHNSPSNYRYYQGSNSTVNAGYNNNLPSNTSDNVCRFGRSATSTPVPQEQGYYSQQFPGAQPEQNVQDMYVSNRGCSIQENLTLPVTNQMSDIEQLTQYATATVSNSVDTLPLKSDDISLSKQNADDFEDVNMEVSIIGTAGPSQDKLCLNNNYSVPSKVVSIDQNPVAKTFVGPTVSQPYQQSMSAK